MKLYHERLSFDDKNDGHVEDLEYIDHEINRTVPSGKAILLGLSPINTADKQDRAIHSKQKVKKFSKNFSGSCTSACNIVKNELLYHY